MKYSMTCSCGDVMTVEGESRDEAVSKLKAIMDEKAISAHMASKHPGEALMTIDQVHKGIDDKLAEVE